MHRGTGLGAIVENTTPAVIAAARSGGDLIEIDVVRSRDGVYFVFHDGKEPDHFGIEANLQTLTAAKIEALSYRQRSVQPWVRVERLDTMLRDLPEDIILNVDRSWRYWPDLLHLIDSHDLADRLLMKIGATDLRAVQAAREHPVKYPLLPIVKRPEDLLDLVGDPSLNVVGAELVTAVSDGPFCDRAWLLRLRADGIFAYVNALDLGNGKVLFAGWDDTVSVIHGPEHGWKHLVDLRADVIQTDWPALLGSYLQQRGVRSVSVAT